MQLNLNLLQVGAAGYVVAVEDDLMTHCVKTKQGSTTLVSATSSACLAVFVDGTVINTHMAVRHHRPGGERYELSPHQQNCAPTTHRF